MLIYAGVLVQSTCCILHESVVCKHRGARSAAPITKKLLSSYSAGLRSTKGWSGKGLRGFMMLLWCCSASDSQHRGLSLFETSFSVLVINTDLKLSCFSWALRCGAYFMWLCIHKGINVDFCLLSECIAKLCSKGQKHLSWKVRLGHH